MKNTQQYVVWGIIGTVVLYLLYKTIRYGKERMESPFKYFTYSEFDTGATAAEIADPNIDTYFSARHGNYRVTGSGEKYMDPDFIRDLDAIREEVGFPMIVNSGYRSDEWNNYVGGASNSSHRYRSELGGNAKVKAADITALTFDQRMAIANAAKKRGISRFGFGNSYIHLDKDMSKDQFAIWNYGGAQKPTHNQLFA